MLAPGSENHVKQPRFVKFKLILRVGIGFQIQKSKFAHLYSAIVIYKVQTNKMRQSKVEPSFVSEVVIFVCKKEDRMES